MTIARSTTFTRLREKVHRSCCSIRTQIQSDSERDEFMVRWLGSAAKPKKCFFHRLLTIKQTHNQQCTNTGHFLSANPDVSYDWTVPLRRLVHAALVLVRTNLICEAQDTQHQQAEDVTHFAGPVSLTCKIRKETVLKTDVPVEIEVDTVSYQGDGSRNQSAKTWDKIMQGSP